MRIPGLENEAERDEDMDKTLNRIRELKAKLPKLTRNPDGLKYYRKKVLMELMGGVCFICGGEFPQAAMDFHHKNPAEKENRIGLILAVAGEDNFWDKALPYIREKCVLVCSNCHRVIHFGNGRTKK